MTSVFNETTYRPTDFFSSLFEIDGVLAIGLILKKERRTMDSEKLGKILGARGHDS